MPTLRTPTTTRTVTVICESSWHYQEYPGNVIQVGEDFVTLAFGKAGADLREKHFTRAGGREIFPPGFSKMDRDHIHKASLEFVNTLPLTSPEQVKINRRVAGSRSQEEVREEFRLKREARNNDTAAQRASDALSGVLGLPVGPDFTSSSIDPDPSSFVGASVILHPLPWSVLDEEGKLSGLRESLRIRMQEYNNKYHERHYIEREGSD